MSAKKKNANPVPKKPRLFSLDVLRGFDMFVFLLLGPLVIALARGPLAEQFESKNYLRVLLAQMEHCTWDGFTLWDQIMPLFLFTAGAAIPYALARYKKSDGGRVSWRFWFRLIRRFVLLWLIGAVMQGNLLEFKVDSLHIYSNTLQAIAVGYLFSAIFYVFFGTRVQIGITAFLLVGYWALEKFIHFTVSDGFGEVGGGTYVYQHTLAEWVDQKLMAGHWAGDGTQTWILTSMTFIVTAMTGVLAGTITRGRAARARSEEGDAEQAAPVETKTAVPTVSVFVQLFLIGAALTAIGYFWSRVPADVFGYCPLIKSVWTPSMTLMSSGISFLLFSLFYLICDLLNFRIGFRFFIVLGVNALLAYIFGAFNDGFFHGNIHDLLFGLEPRLGSWYPVLLVCVNFAVIYFILWLLYNGRKYLRV